MRFSFNCPVVNTNIKRAPMDAEWLRNMTISSNVLAAEHYNTPREVGLYHDCGPGMVAI